MDLEMVNKGLGYTQKRKKWIILIAALGCSTYGAYRVCRLPSVIKKRDRAMKVLRALTSVVEFLGDSSETIGVIPKDLKEFVQSDSDQIPSSLSQVFKITRSDEFSESIVRVTRALTVGILKGYRVEPRKGDSGTSFPDKALDKLFSPAGSGFVSVVVGSFAKNMVMAIYAEREVTGGSILNGSSDSVQRWVDVIADDKCKKLIGDCIQQVVSTMVTVYLDKTMDINPYEEILSGLTNPKHEEKVRDLLAMVCNGAIETLVKTSHQVLTNSKANGNPDSSSPSSLYFLRKSSSPIDGQEVVLSQLKARENQGNGWGSKMSSTLAIPGNMRFVVDVTGRVTITIIKSFLEFCLNQLSEGMKKGGQELVDKGCRTYRDKCTEVERLLLGCKLWTLAKKLKVGCGLNFGRRKTTIEVASFSPGMGQHENSLVDTDSDRTWWGNGYSLHATSPILVDHP